MAYFPIVGDVEYFIHFYGTPRSCIKNCNGSRYL